MIELTGHHVSEMQLLGGRTDGLAADEGKMRERSGDKVLLGCKECN